MTSNQAQISSSSPSLPNPSRLLIVSNRLPVSITHSPSEGEDGKDGSSNYIFSQGSGGLITGLSGLAKSTMFRWYGWTGLEVPDSAQEKLALRLKKEYDAYPVFLDDELSDLYYNKFASKFVRLVKFHGEPKVHLYRDFVF